jgi:hypothetical protein
MALSLKSALLGEVPPQIRADTQISEILRTVPSSLVHYLEWGHGCSEDQAIHFAAMLSRQVSLRRALADPRVALSLKSRKGQATEDPNERSQAVGYMAQMMANGFRKWSKDNQVPPEDMGEAFVYYAEQMHERMMGMPPLAEVAEESKGQVWEEILAGARKLAESYGLKVGDAALVPAGGVPEGPKQPESEDKWANMEDFESWVDSMETVTPDHIIDAYQNIKNLLATKKITKKKFDQYMTHLRGLSHRVTARVLIGRMARRMAQAQPGQIVIPPTTDTPTPKNVMLPEKDSTAPPSDKVALSPTTSEDKKDAVDESIGDEQKTRQEQLANSFRALDVVLKDFVKAMYGIELSREYMGKLLDGLIDKASDCASTQTADTVKQLASPFIGE